MRIRFNCHPFTLYINVNQSTKLFFLASTASEELPHTRVLPPPAEAVLLPRAAPPNASERVRGEDG